MNSTTTPPDAKASPFVLKDCALIAIATNRHASTLKEFRDHIDTLSPDSLYHHFWANLLLPRFDEPEYINDFASWARHSLHDAKLAEELAVLDPMSVADLEELRYRILELIDDRLDESEYLQWYLASQRFEFIRSQLVVFDTHIRVGTPFELANLIPQLSSSCIFYHFIDARRRTENKIDDFRQWLTMFGESCQPLIERLAVIDPYFYTLVELRQRLAAICQSYFQENA